MHHRIKKTVWTKWSETGRHDHLACDESKKKIEKMEEIIFGWARETMDVVGQDELLAACWSSIPHTSIPNASNKISIICSRMRWECSWSSLFFLISKMIWRFSSESRFVERRGGCAFFSSPTLFICSYTFYLDENFFLHHVATCAKHMVLWIFFAGWKEY